jgi:hypothetical protein
MTLVTGNNNFMIAQQYAFTERIAVPSLPPSIQTSVHKAITNGAFFMNHNAVLLPPPAGLFSNWSAPSTPVHRMGDILNAQSYPACQLPAFRNQHVSTGCSYIEPQGHSSTAQRRVREGADSDGSDDNQSQCSTASYDGSQRNKSNAGKSIILDCNSMEESHIANTVGDSSNSDALGDEKRDAQDMKKRTWKVLLTPEQACEVRL